MLVRKAVSWQESKQPSVYVGSAEKLQRREKFLLDLSPEMRQIGKVAILFFVCTAIILSFRVLIFSSGHDLVGKQTEIVELTKANDQLSLDVAELKSPIRIQEIAQKNLGMVLPDAFLYSSKSATVEREVKVDHPIVD